MLLNDYLIIHKETGIIYDPKSLPCGVINIQITHAKDIHLDITLGEDEWIQGFVGKHFELVKRSSYCEGIST